MPQSQLLLGKDPVVPDVDAHGTRLVRKPHLLSFAYRCSQLPDSRFCEQAERSADAPLADALCSAGAIGGVGR